MEGVTVTNIMADGSICDDLTGYFDTHEMPPEVKAIIRQMVLGSEKRRAELNESLKGRSHD